jgi:very-short-patch-repair endonuclease
MLSSAPSGIRRAKRLRRQMNLPEILLWQQLRTRPGGHKFRRQHPAGHYTLDFYCHEAALCIEVDGMAHDMGDNPERDIKRDAWLDRQGVRVLRLPATLVLRNISEAIEAIIAAANEQIAAF